MFKIFARIIVHLIDIILWCIDSNHRTPENIDDNYKKFTHQIPQDFNSDFAKCKNAFRTVPYNTYLLQTETHQLVAADKHLIFLSDGSTKWVEDLTTDDIIETDNGPEKVVLVKNLNTRIHMYDLEIDSKDHKFLTSGIASHNTEAAVSYMLWFAMFSKNRNVLMVAHKFEHISEIMKRIKQVYEMLPPWLKCGVLADGYNARSIKFENGSQIQGTATTPSAGRGKSIHLLYIDEFAFVPPNIAKEFWASVKPTLSTTEGKCIITSTPSNDDDEFAQIWFGAKNTQDEHGYEDPTGIGRNGFKAIFADWKEHPNRDDLWAKKELASIGDERFRREFNCCNGSIEVNIKDENGIEKMITLEDLYNNLEN